MLSMGVFVVVYATCEATKTKQTQIEHFENTTITMEHVTENYLEGEQRICDVWARYINSEDMTMDEAASFISISHVLPTASAHIIYQDTLSGKSTRSKNGENTVCDVTYDRNSYDFLKDLSWIHEIGTSINISRSFTNPINYEDTIAFSNLITLKEGANLSKLFCFAYCQNQS